MHYLHAFDKDRFAVGGFGHAENTDIRITKSNGFSEKNYFPSPRGKGESSI
jgi:hypothetical protein